MKHTENQEEIRRIEEALYFGENI